MFILPDRKTPNGCKQSVSLEDDMGMCHCWVTSDGLCVNVITDNEYPESSAYNLVGQIIMDFLETFDSQREIWVDATKDLDLKYEKLEEFLKNW